MACCCGATNSGEGARMSFEIEREFFFETNCWEKLTTGRIAIRQAYLAADGKASIRVRIRDESAASLTVKSRGAGLRRLELEYPIPVLEAEALIQLRQGSVIEKVRHLVPCGESRWEIDVFAGANSGLIIAEIELRHENQRVELPDWIGLEITGQGQYYNSSLAQRPFCTWLREGHMPMEGLQRAR